MNLREQAREAALAERLDDLEQLVATEPRAVRYLLGFTYRPDRVLAARAARGIALAARHHPQMIENIIRRLIWAMNEESGANSLTAPIVIRALAIECPDLLVPVVPDLIRLSQDESLREELQASLRMVVEQCPGSVGEHLQASLNQQIAQRNSHEH